MTVVGSNEFHAAASPPKSQSMVCALEPVLGLRSPPMSTKALNRSGRITVRSSAHVPPAENPTTPHLDGSELTPKVEIMNGTTSLVRWSGNTPVFVFVDSGGAFNIDTECVNGSRGNAA